MIVEQTARPDRPPAVGPLSFAHHMRAAGGLSGLVLLEYAVLRAVGTEMQAAWPRECCGALLGDPVGIRAAQPLPNTALVADEFDLDPCHVERTAHAADRRGLRICGWFHSHPHGRPTPSRRDLLGTFPIDADSSFHLIVSPRRGWRLYAVGAAGWRALSVRLVSPEWTT